MRRAVAGYAAARTRLTPSPTQRPGVDMQPSICTRVRTIPTRFARFCRVRDDLVLPIPCRGAPRDNTLYGHIPTRPEGRKAHGRYSTDCLWLASFQFFSSRALNLFILVGESPRISYNEDSWGSAVRRRGAGGLTHSDCIMARCATPLRACYSHSACRSAMNEFFASLEFNSVIPHWNEGAILDGLDQSPLEGALQSRLENAVTCFFEHCECQPLDFSALKGNARTRRSERGEKRARRNKLPVARYPGAVSQDELRTIRSLGEELRKDRSTRRTFGVGANGHLVTQLDPEFSSRHETAKILSKLKALAVRSDIDMGWRVVDPELLRPRTIELSSAP